MSSSPARQAIKNIRLLSDMFKGLQALGEELQEHVDLEGRAATLRRDIADLEAKAAAAGSNAGDAENDAAQRIADAQARVAKIEAQAAADLEAVTRRHAEKVAATEESAAAAITQANTSQAKAEEAAAAAASNLANIETQVEAVTIKRDRLKNALGQLGQSL